VKFCLVKRDLTKLSEQDIALINAEVLSKTALRSDLIDIDSHPISEIRSRRNNLMWFCAGTSLSARDTYIDYVEGFRGELDRFQASARREGIRSEGGSAKVLFITRKFATRASQAFLHFETEDLDNVNAVTNLHSTYVVEKESLAPTLRTAIGLPRFDATGNWDYVAKQPYNKIANVQRAAGFEGELDEAFWIGHRSTLESVRTNLALICRMNPYSPNSHHIAFFSETPISPGDQLAAIATDSVEQAKALCVLFNSSIFLAQFFLNKEESTGRFLHIRTTDLRGILLLPRGARVDALAEVFDDFRECEFPSLRHQFDQGFDNRYGEFWERQRGENQPALWDNRDSGIQPSETRINFDLRVAEALGRPTDVATLNRVYSCFIEEMIITRGLTRD
jgi:hypothetical protein